MLNLATIGRGFIVEDALDALNDVPEINLYAAYSRKLEDAKEFAGSHGFEKAYGDLDELLIDPDLDAVYIASPNALHYPQARKALEAGKHVILEKPFVSNIDQARELFDLAEKNGVMIFEAITTPHTLNFKKLKEQLDRAGNIKQVVLNFNQYSSRYDKYRNGEVTNAFDPEMDGGALMDINLYNIHFTTALFGKPKEVIYLPNLGFNGVDTSGILLLKYPDFTVTAIGSKDNGTPYLFYISGEDGYFTIDQGGVNEMNHVTFTPKVNRGEKAESEEISLPHRNRMVYEFKDFAKAIEEKDINAFNKWKEQTMTVQDILDQAKSQRDSIREKQ